MVTRLTVQEVPAPNAGRAGMPPRDRRTSQIRRPSAQLGCEGKSQLWCRWNGVSGSEGRTGKVGYVMDRIGARNIKNTLRVHCIAPASLERWTLEAWNAPVPFRLLPQE